MTSSALFDALRVRFLCAVAASCMAASNNSKLYTYRVQSTLMEATSRIARAHQMASDAVSATREATSAALLSNRLPMAQAI